MRRECENTWPRVSWQPPLSAPRECARERREIEKRELWRPRSSFSRHFANPHCLAGVRANIRADARKQNGRECIFRDSDNDTRRAV